jgi:anti-sigma factor RsiW
MTKRRDITEDHLHAYVDGQLDGARRIEVEAYLAEHPAEARRVEAYQQQNLALRSLFAMTPGQSSNHPRRSRNASYLRYAAVLFVGLFGGAIGWVLRGETVAVTAFTQFPREAAIAHVVYAPEVRHAVEVTAQEESHLVAWLSKRMGASVRAPHLRDVGYELMGGRLLPSDNGPAAQFMYQDVQGRRLTLYVRRMSKPREATAFRYSRDDGLSIFYWVDGPLAYALSGDIGKGELLRAANAVYHSINP